MEKEIERVFTMHMKYRHIDTIEEFKEVFYNPNEDKKGLIYICNMFMSLFQARKVNAGNDFEKNIKNLFYNEQIKFISQKYVDTEGIVYDKKPKKNNHKLDFIIPFKDTLNIKSCIVISAKTSLRERYRQDLDMKDKCKKLIYLTKETPSISKIKTIIENNCIIVYPSALVNENVWSFEHFILRMKQFQNTGSYNFT